VRCVVVPESLGRFGFGLAADQPPRRHAISVRITADEHAVLRVLAAERAQTISDAVRTVLMSAVRKEKSERAA